MKRQRHRIVVVLALAALTIALSLGAKTAAQTAQAVRGEALSLGLVSEVYQKQIQEHFREFVRYVARRLSSAGEVEANVVIASGPLQLAKLLEEKKVDFYMESSYPTYLINRQGIAVLILRRWKGGMAEYRSLIFTKTDSGPSRLEELRGKMIAFEDPGSTSGHFLPKVLLLKKGFKLTEKTGPEVKVAPGEIGYIFASTDRNVVNLVLSKRVAAGAISNDDHNALDEKIRAEIAILAETESFPRHLVSVRKDLRPAVVKELKEILLSMHQNDEGRRILNRIDNTTKFDPLPGGEAMVRRKLVELYRPRGKQ
jgi:phosphonate transport system substrate-binding protein